MIASKHDSNKPPLDLVDGLFYKALWGYTDRPLYIGHPEPDEVVDAVYAIDAAEGKEALLATIVRASQVVTERLLDDGETPYLQLVNVLEFGAWKYAPGNWRKGLPRARVYAAALRHVHARSEGDYKDDETGLPHLAHALCELMFLYWYVVKDIDLPDDRFVEKESRPEKQEPPQGLTARKGDVVINPKANINEPWVTRLDWPAGSSVQLVAARPADLPAEYVAAIVQYDNFSDQGVVKGSVAWVRPGSGGDWVPWKQLGVGLPKSYGWAGEWFKPIQ